MLTKNNLTEFDLMQGRQVVKVIRGSRVNSYVIPKKVTPTIFQWQIVDFNKEKR